MERLSRGPYFKAIVDAVAQRSTCLRRQVGAVVTDERWVILGTGHNGVPRSLPHCGEAYAEQELAWRRSRGFDVLAAPPVCNGAKDTPGDTKRCWAVHAEVNALLQCSDLERARHLFVSATPCFECAKAIANTGVTHVYAVELYADYLGLDVLKRRGIVLSLWDYDYSHRDPDFYVRP